MRSSRRRPWRDGRCRRERGRRQGDRARHHRLDRDSRRRGPAAARRLLSLVRPSRQGRGARITEGGARARSLPAIEWCGGVYSSEWGFAKLLHWLRHNPVKRDKLVTALEHCDMVTATLCGITDAAQGRRAASARWVTSGCGTRNTADFRPRRSCVAVDPLLKGVRAKLEGEYRHVGRTSRGALSAEWAEKLGLKAGHSDSRSARSTPTGTRSAPGSPRATWSMSSAPPPASWRCARSRSWSRASVAWCRGSIHPDYVGIEAGLSACGYLFERDRPAAEHDRGGTCDEPRRISRRADRLAALRLGQRRPHRAGQPRRRRRRLRLEPQHTARGRAVRGDRGHCLPHAHHPRTDARARRAGPAA